MSKDVITGSARGQVSARLLDLSLGGALLNLGTSLEVGAIHDFSLDLGGATVWVQAEVKRCQRSERDPGYLVGVEFLGIDPKDQRLLRQYLDRA